MEKIILVDGNNLLFRSYYATAYNGNLMKNSKGFPTNGLFGFVNMINKIINEENPVYMIVAFDKGKTFRHEKFDVYKDGRSETPDALKQQFPIAKEILGAMGIKYYEIDNYEADDIIGTFAAYCNKDSNYVGTVISSDKDLLQLISSDVEVKLLKSKDYIRYNEAKFREDYGIDPIKIIDLKALMGDASDNIPGVKGIGEKTALKLLQEHGSLDAIYENIESIKGATKEKLINGKDSAYMSFEIATIVCDVPMEIELKDIIYKGEQTEELNKMYEELEFYSFLKKMKVNKVSNKSEIEFIQSIADLKITKPFAFHIETLGSNYHQSKVIGMGIHNEEQTCFVKAELIEDVMVKLANIEKSTYDLKKAYVSFKKLNIDLINVKFDTMLAAALLDFNIKDDIAYFATQQGYEVQFFESTYGKGTKLAVPEEEVIAKDLTEKAKVIFETKAMLIEKLVQDEQIDLYNSIELPLAIVLGDMEYAGVYVDSEILKEMGTKINARINEIKNEIYELVGEEFNISSPLQLGKILFEKLELPHGKKTKTGYSTNVDVLTRLQGKHPIIELIMEYRTLTKLYSTYIEGLLASIHEDNKIHTIYTQALTRTGRLSSIEPNLQNIPIRYEYGKLIRKAFIPSKDSVLVSGDYSQIELRIFAHMANIESLKYAFEHDIDVHTKTASDIFKVDINEITKDQRRIAKAVNFGILYGISSFGLSENLKIPPYEAQKFIDNYFETYPGIKDYMDNAKKEAYEKKYVRTLLNRKRNIEELSNTNYMIRQQGERIAMNTPIQGTSADIIKKAMVEIHQKFKDEKIKSQIIMQVHDELVIDVLKEEEEKVTSIVKETMEKTFELTVPLKVEFERGENWYEAK